MKPVIISLCDLTGTFVKPWTDNGYDAILVDPQHPEGVTETINPSGTITTRIGAVILDAIPALRPIIRFRSVAYVAGWPPCTDVALSGTKHWARKREADPQFQAKAALVAEQCRVLGMISGAPWHFENPKSAFSSIFGRCDFKFHPWQFTGLCPGDNYNKETWLWTGGGWNPPQPTVAPHIQSAVDTVYAVSGGKHLTKANAIKLVGAAAAQHYPDDRIHLCGPGDERANIRSATPAGFSQAVFLANKR